MKKPGLTIGGAMGLIALFGVGFAALKGASTLWSIVMFSATVFLIAGWAVVALLRRGRLGGFATGFCVFGGGYLLLTFAVIPEANGVRPPAWITSVALEAARPEVFDGDRVVVETEHWGPNFGDPSLSIQPNYLPMILVQDEYAKRQFVLSQPKIVTATSTIADAQPYRCVGHCLFSLILGGLGGGLGLLVAPRLL